MYLRRPIRRLMAVTLVAGCVATGCVVSAAPALAAGTSILTLATADASQTAAQLSGRIGGCGTVHGGADATTDGWTFDQPASGADAFAYTVGFIVDGTTPQVIGINATGAVSVSLDPSNPQIGTAPAGVSGGLTTDGAWLRTPSGWQIVTGALQVDVSTTVTTFDLTAVCPAASAPSPSHAPSRAPSHSPETSPPPRTPTAGSGRTLPVTGPDAAFAAVAGLLLLGVGAVLLIAGRRRRVL
jgi:hypothetical protein